jgi:hypothetical protein
MLGRSCPTCGLGIGRDAHEHEGVLHCCRGCAERTFCTCRVTVAAGVASERWSDPDLTRTTPAGAGRPRPA